MKFFSAVIFWSAISVSLSARSAVDCAKIKPFKALKKTETYKIEASQLYWREENGSQIEDSKEICTVEGKLTAYDIRGREDEAFHCLKPEKKDIYVCETSLGGQPAKMFLLPAIWVRTWKPKDAREYRFHAVVQIEGKAADYVDIFARTLSFNLKASNIVTEGAIKNGPAISKDGFFVRATFSK